jgi:hypothetical protein
VVIDVKLFETRNPEDAVRLQPLNDEKPRAISGEFDDSSDDDEYRWAAAVQHAFQRRYCQLKKRHHDSRVCHATHEEPMALNDHHRRLCTPIVSGYCLSAKCWGQSDRPGYIITSSADISQRDSISISSDQSNGTTSLSNTLSCHAITKHSSMHLPVAM